MNTKRRRALFVMFMALIALNANAGKFKIIKIAPNQKILIGNDSCGVGDTFSDTDKIHWDKNLMNQAIRVVCIQKECKCMYTTTMDLSKKQFLNHTGNDVSYNKLISLVSKGDEVQEPLILWANDTILLDIVPEEGYQYYCYVKGYHIKESLYVYNNQVCIISNMLLKYSYMGKLFIDIIKSKIDNPTDTKVIAKKELECVHY